MSIPQLQAVRRDLYLGAATRRMAVAALCVEAERNRVERRRLLNNCLFEVNGASFYGARKGYRVCFDWVFVGQSRPRWRGCCFYRASRLHESVEIATSP
jgi:hypothetical protein